MIKTVFSTALLFLLFYSSVAQNTRPAVGQWNAYLPYSTTIDFDTDGDMFYCVSTSSFFTYEHSTGELVAYSKANGMSDVNMNQVAYDDLTSTAVLVYENGNIDLFKDGSFYNIPDFKISTISGDRTIYSAYCAEGFCFISTGSGLLVVNISNKEIKETIPFYLGSSQGINYDAGGKGQTIYAATSVGLFRSNISNPLLINYASWTKLSAINLSGVSQGNDQVFLNNENTIYTLQNNVPVAVKAIAQPIIDVVATADDHAWVGVRGINNLPSYAIKINSSGAVVDSLPNLFAYKIIELGDGLLWSCDGYAGLKSKSVSNPNNEWASHHPAGPLSNGAYSVWAKDGMFLLAHGAYDLTSWGLELNQDYFAKYINGDWRNYKWDVLGLTSTPWTLADAISIVKDDINNKFYVGMYSGGIIEVDENDQLKNYKNPYLEYNNQGDSSSYRVTDLALDAEQNLWITQSTVSKALRVKTAAGQWHSFNVGTGHAASLMIDDYGQKWMSAEYTEGGLIIFNDNGTIDDPNDDRTVRLRRGEGNGNLSSNTVYSIAKDKNGAIWVGTKSGVSIFNCAMDIRDQICDAYLKPLQSKGYNFANYMFENMPVRAIAIDGGNRKWFGTDAGLFLIDEDGEQILAEYNVNNSPLLSNTIISLDIDPTTGIVYVSTDKGLCSIGGEAVEAGSEISKSLLVYPNPVPSGYNGMIAIKGMTEDADIRITDINGQLVYRTSSAGGQVAWNGMDYRGRRVQSGVYLVFVVGKDGSQKGTGKFIIHE